MSEETVTVDHEDPEDQRLTVQRLFPSSAIRDFDDLEPFVLKAVEKFKDTLEEAGAAIQEGENLQLRVTLGITPTMGAVTVSALVDSKQVEND